MGIQWQDESVSLVYLPFQDEGRVEEMPRQKIIPAPLPFDCGESDSHLDCSFFFTQKCFWNTPYTALQTKRIVAVSLVENFEQELFCKLAEQWPQLEQ